MAKKDKDIRAEEFKTVACAWELLRNLDAYKTEYKKWADKGKPVKQWHKKHQAIWGFAPMQDPAKDHAPFELLSNAFQEFSPYPEISAIKLLEPDDDVRFFYRGKDGGVYNIDDDLLDKNLFTKPPKKLLIEIDPTLWNKKCEDEIVALINQVIGLYKIPKKRFRFNSLAESYFVRVLKNLDYKTSQINALLWGEKNPTEAKQKKTQRILRNSRTNKG